MPSTEIYIAGPDVFFPQASAHFERIRQALALRGLTALVPSDGDLPAGLPYGPALAARLFEENTRLIRRAAGLLVNLNAFRGTEPDSGTCFEVGMAYALGKPIVAYVDSDELYVDRVARLCGVQDEPRTSARYDAREGCLIEDMGLPVNLMLACSTDLVTTGLTAAIDRLAERMPRAGA